MNKKTPAFLVPALLLGLCIAAFLGVFIRPGLVDRGRDSLRTAFDFQSYFMPRFVLGSKELFSGHLPVWNRFEYGGIPLLATAQPAALYPPKAILFGLFSPVAALWIYFALHYVALGATFLVFLRQQGVRGLAAFAGTAVWVFSPPLLLSHYNPVRIANMVWMPLLFVLSEKVARERRVGPFAWLALVVALQLVAGYPEATIDTGFLIAIHAVASYAAKRWTEPPWLTVPRIAAAFLLGALVAGAQMFPLAELASIAQRRNVVSAVVQPVRDPFAALLSTIPALSAVVIAGFFVRRARPAVVGFVVCAAMGLGGWLVLRRLPGFSMGRFPYVWVFLWVFYFGWLAAEGAGALLDVETLKPRLRLAVLGLTALAALTAVVCFVAAGLDRTPLDERTSSLARYVSTPLAAVLGAAGSALLLAAAALAGRRRAPSWLWAGSFTLLTLSHLAGFPYGNVSSPFGRPRRHGQVRTLLGKDLAVDGRTLSLEDLLYGYEVSDALPSPLGVEFSFLPFRYRQLLLRLKFLPVYGTIDWPVLMNARGLLNAMDVQYVVGHFDVARTLEDAGLVPVRRTGTLMLYENEKRMGHAWVSYAVHREPTEDAALDYVLGGDFEPSRATLLEADTVRVYPGKSRDAPTAPSSERRHSSTDVEFDVDLKKPGVFIHSESAYPGWVATIDGAPAPILVGNYVQRAVEVPAGRHTVRFRYRPASVRYGLIASGLGLAVVAALFAVGRKRRGLAAPPIS